jgi:hypothetical protein
VLVGESGFLWKNGTRPCFENLVTPSRGRTLDPPVDRGSRLPLHQIQTGLSSSSGLRNGQLKEPPSSTFDGKPLTDTQWEA